MNRNHSSNTETKFCIHCGKENPITSKYCIGCGYEIPEKTHGNYSVYGNSRKHQQHDRLKHERQRNNSITKVSKKKRYWGLITFMVFTVLLFFTNPNEKSHLDFLNNKVHQKLNIGETFEPEFVNLIESEKLDIEAQKLLERYVKIKNYLFFSLTEVKSEDKFAVISFGVLGKIIDLERINEFFIAFNSKNFLTVIGVTVLFGFLLLLIIVNLKCISKGGKIIWTLLIVFLLLFTEYILVEPVITFSSIKTGIQEKDSERLSENIDFPKFRQNIKEQFTTSMLKSSTQNSESNLLSILATGLATKLVDGAIDLYVTPSGLISLIEDRTLHNENKSNNRNLKKFEYSYDSLSKFSVWVTNESGEKIRFVLTREGLSWKLTNIVFPLEE